MDTPVVRTVITKNTVGTADSRACTSIDTLKEFAQERTESCTTVQDSSAGKVSLTRTDHGEAKATSQARTEVEKSTGNNMFARAVVHSPARITYNCAATPDAQY